ncbi:unnamed protein product [Orchesella dallaii]|uniref:Dynamin-1-like protein n=1 Tax=Orchesella dallaii TaxID=48710 RepID=A0ABP1S0Q9_9HEXA
MLEKKLPYENQLEDHDQSDNEVTMERGNDETTLEPTTTVVNEWDSVQHPQVQNPHNSFNAKDFMTSYNKVCDQITKLKMEGHKVQVDYPQIVVVGAQSSGKTSLLETIAKEDFLPKGSDIQTRCPIELQLIRTTDGKKYVEFLDKPGRKFFNMEEVKREIENVNEAIKREKVKVKNRNGVYEEKERVVSDFPITLKLFSPNVPNLTLVDLPGLCPSPKDNQPKDLNTKIKQVLMQYMSNPNSIILAVVPASQELETDTTTEFVEEADPERKRTILTITKLDAVSNWDTLPNVKKSLQGENKFYPVGVVGVVCRHKQHTPQSVQEFEKQILVQHFPTIAEKHGMSYFVDLISRSLFTKILESLPTVKAIISAQICHLKERIKELGVHNVNYMFNEYVTGFSETYRSQIHGEKRNLFRTDYPLSTKVHEIFEKTFFPEVDNFTPCEGVSDEEIDIAIHCSKGIQGHERLKRNTKNGVDPTDVYHCLITKEIKKLKPIVMKCASLVNLEMRAAIDTSHDPTVVATYKKLVERINAATLELIKKSLEDCETHLEVYINAESCVAFTTDPFFYEKMGNGEKKLGKGKTVETADDAAQDFEYASENDMDKAETIKEGRTSVKNKTSLIASQATEKLVNYSMKKGKKKGKKVKGLKPKAINVHNQSQQAEVGGLKGNIRKGTQIMSEIAGKASALGPLASYMVDKVGEGIEFLIPDGGDDDDDDSTQIDSQRGNGKWSKKDLKIFDGIRKQIHIYFVQVKWSMKNYVPKAIMETIVYGVERRLKRELLDCIKKDAKIECDADIKKLMRLSDKLELERENAEKALERYQKTYEVLEQTMVSSRMI